MLIKPFYEAGGAGGAGKEIFNYELINAKRGAINTALNDALATLNKGTQLIDDNFVNGAAMSGSGANVVKSKWTELEAAIKSFKQYIDNTLDNVNVVNNNNVSFEQSVADIFGTTE